MDHTNHNHQEHQMGDIKIKRKFSDYIPLIIIFALIIVFTIFMQIRNEGDLMYVMRIFMAGFFLVFGTFKVINLKGFVEAYSTYDIIAKRSRVYGFLYPFIELGLGYSYFQAFNLFYTNIITLIVMIVGAIGVFIELRKKVDIPCACLGVVFKIPMTKVTLLEDLLMAGMAAGMLGLG